MVTKVQDVQTIGANHAGSGKSIQTGAVATAWLKKKTISRILFAAGDTAALLLSHVSAKFVVQRLFSVPAENLNPHDYWFFYLPFVLAVVYLLDRGHNPDVRRPEKELELALKGISFAFLLLVCANFVVFDGAAFSRYLMVAWFLIALPLVLVSRFSLRHLYGALWRRGLARRRTLLLGSAERLSEFHSLLAIQRYQAYEIVGVLPCEGVPLAEDAPRSVPVLGSLSRWRDVVRENRVEQVVVCLPHTSEESHQMLSNVLHACLPAGIDVQVYSDLFAARHFNYELDEFSGFFRFFAANRWPSKAQFAAKKAVDFVGGTLGSLVTLLVLPIVALAIKTEDRGPVFYRRAYFGPDERSRHDLKFRSMRVNADEILRNSPNLWARYIATEKLSDDPRVTRVGRVLRKYSIDELPQFFSVLAGRLSLVGPRVISREAAQKYGERLPKLFSVKPGLTGFWQVMGRQLTSSDEHIQMDMFYIDHWSIWLDFWIIAKTIWRIVRPEGAY